MGIFGTDDAPPSAGRVPGPDHNGPSATAVVPGPVGEPDTDVSNWSLAHKVSEAIRCALPFLLPDVQEQVMALLSPKGLALMVAVAAIQFVPFVGEGLDAVVMGYVWITFGWDVVKNTKTFFVKAIGAHHYSDLKEAGHALSKVVTAIGVMRFVELLHDMGGKAADEAAEKQVVEELKPEETPPAEEVPPEKVPELADRLPLNRNPRPLAKHPGQVTVQALVEEVTAKGFQKIKGEDGELEGIYARRVRVEGQEYYEAVRIDSPHGKPWTPSGKTPGVTQASKDAAFRRDHMLNDAPGNPQGKALGNQLSQGRQSGSFAHWHHELVPAKPGILEQYTSTGGDKASVEMGVRKLDFSNREVDYALRMKPSDAKAAATQRLNDRFGK